MTSTDVSRRRRADALATLLTPESALGMSLTANVEDGYLMWDAVRCFWHGADAGAIFCVHAVCERDLAALVDHSPSPPAARSRWGLGTLISHCRAKQLVPTDLLDQLSALNRDRKALYHYGHSHSASGLQQKVEDLITEIGAASLREQFFQLTGRQGRDKEVYRFATDQVLERNALAALATGLRLRAWLATQSFNGTDG